VTSIYNEMIYRLGLPIEEAVGARVTVCGFKAVCVEGHGGVLKVEDTQVLLRYKKKKLVISGKELSVLEITKDEVYIKGKISAVTTEEFA